ncbi:MAG: leucine-rich repeat domain-containing protein [Lepagella sp.]
MKKFYLILAALLVGISSYAETWENSYNGIYYEFDDATMTACVMNHPSGNSNYTGGINIPASIVYPEGTFTVTSIAEKAFYQSNITSVTLPNTITSIGINAFAESKSLESVDIPRNCDGLTSIPSRCFEECSKLKQIEFPNKLQYIGSFAFKNCNISVLKLLNTCLVEIGNSAFYGCLPLFDIWFPDNSLRTIGQQAFANCNICNLKLPNTVSSINSSAFANNLNLNYVTLSNNLRHIPENCFSEANLEHISIPQSVEKISGGAFKGCNKLSVSCHRLNPPIIEDTDENPAFEYSFKNVELSVPKSSLSKYQEAEGWKKFGSIKAMADPTYDNAFLCDGVYYEILEGADVAVTGACSTDQPVVIPEKVHYYETEFYPVEIATGAFENNDWLTAIELPSSVTENRPNAFFSCSNLQSIDLSNVDYIEDAAFYECINLKSIKMRTEFCAWGEKVFAYCFSLESITLPQTAYLSKMTFLNCSSLKQVYMPKNCVKIFESAFRGCSSLESIVIPDDVTDIYEEAFLGCTALKTVYAHPTTPPTMETLNVFSQETYNNATLIVPDGTYEAYAQSYAWECFDNIKGDSAVDGIAADEDNLPVEYYNMQGVKVENPQNGIFIRRQGSKTEKITL